MALSRPTTTKVRHRPCRLCERTGAGQGGGPVLDTQCAQPAVARCAVIESFDDMDLKEDLLRGIYSYGFEKPSAIQQRAIKPLLLMRDTIAQAQSGTGKTATFAIGEARRP